MYATTLHLTDFRSWSTAQVGFEEGVNALVGANGEGKTNLIEALGYAASGSSHRVSSDLPLVKNGSDRAIIRCRAIREDREAQVDIEINARGTNRARINGNSVRRLADAMGMIRAVTFAPEDVNLIKGDPETRRRFIDSLLIQRSPRLAGVIADYERVLKQRSSLLKTAGQAGRGGRRVDLRTLDVWDEHLAHYGATLILERQALVNDLAPRLVAAYDTLASKAAPTLTYRSSLPVDPLPTTPEDLTHHMLATLASLRTQELERGMNLVGPHRDDLVLTIHDLPARTYSSHGESWSLALALRLASFTLMCQDNVVPILILDDVFAELDITRREALVSQLDQADQVIITAAVPHDVPSNLVARRITVHHGMVTYD